MRKRKVIKYSPSYKFWCAEKSLHYTFYSELKTADSSKDWLIIYENPSILMKTASLKMDVLPAVKNFQWLENRWSTITLLKQNFKKLLNIDDKILATFLTRGKILKI